MEQEEDKEQRFVYDEDSEHHRPAKSREAGYYWVSRCTQQTVREIGWYNGKKWQLMNSTGLWYERDLRNINEKMIGYEIETN